MKVSYEPVYLVYLQDRLQKKTEYYFTMNANGTLVNILLLCPGIPAGN